MIDTIMFDLDGTLLRFSQEAFIGIYFKELEKTFINLGMDGALSVKAVWAGTKAMMANDGKKLNRQIFWKTFADFLKLDNKILKIVEDASDRFYDNEFNLVSSVVEPSDISSRLVKAMNEKGYKVVLATNPLFPPNAVTARLGWIGLSPKDFIHITHYANSTYCKPNSEYYNEILKKINKKPEQCIMIGNNAIEDMSAEALGIKSFLVTDYLENESGINIDMFHQGTFDELEKYLLLYPDIK